MKTISDCTEDIHLSKDGDKWCALLGDNIQEGTAAFGDTKEDAIMALAQALPRSALMTSRSEFVYELRMLLNSHSIENGSNTPDYVLARFLIDSLNAFEEATRLRETFHGTHAPRVPVSP